MKLLTSILAAVLVLAMVGCTAEQRKNCAVCRFIAGEGWVCEKPADPNAAPQVPK